jgi:hypothetical protein
LRTSVGGIGIAIPVSCMAAPVSLFIDYFNRNRLLTPVPGVVHAVSYSLLLLNTDLHVAELSTRMSRNQFVRNTLAAIQTQLQSPPPLSEVSATDLTYDDCGSIRGSDVTETAVATPATRTNRSGSVTSWNSTTREILPGLAPGISSAASPARPTNGSTPSIQISLIQETKNLSSSGTSSIFYGRNWENEMESLLKVGNHVTARRICLIFFVVKGNVQCHQEPADFTASRQWHSHAVIHVLIEPWSTRTA